MLQLLKPHTGRLGCALRGGQGAWRRSSVEGGHGHSKGAAARHARDLSGHSLLPLLLWLRLVLLLKLLRWLLLVLLLKPLLWLLLVLLLKLLLW